MPLVPAKCPECGGNINIDPDKKAAICEFCKQPFVVEDAINNFNTTYNITNNNEIKADVVNVFNGESIESEIKQFKDKISLTLKLMNEDDSLTKSIKELYVFKETHKENVLAHEAFMEALIDGYYFALDGHSWSNIGLGQYSNRYPKPLETLLNEVKIIHVLDTEKGKQADAKVKKFFDDLHSVIITPISKTNSINEIKGRYVSRHAGLYEDSYRQERISIESLGWDFIMNEHYHESYKEVFDSRIHPIKCICEEHYLGYDFIYGRFAAADAYYIDDGYRCSFREAILLDVSVTEKEQINELIEKNKNRISPAKLYQLEEEVGHLKWKYQDERKCYECGNKLSLTGKCKTYGCKYYNKSIKEEISLLEKKIRLAKM